MAGEWVCGRMGVTACRRVGVVGLSGLCGRSGLSGQGGLVQLCPLSPLMSTTPTRRLTTRNYSAQTVSPATIVRTARPFRFQPSKGVLRDRDRDSAFL
jgi:hypothetical protein